MPSSNASLNSFLKVITVEWPKKQEEDARQHLINVAKAGHAAIMAEQMSRSGSKPMFEVYANRPGQTNIELVEIPGPIVYTYRYLKEIIEFALNALREASPVQSGKYRDGHKLYLDGAQTDTVPDTIPYGVDVMISNVMPYARRLEVGKTKSGRAFVVQVPPKIYERTVRLVRAKYRNVVKITFSYADISGPGGRTRSPAMVFEDYGD